MRVRSVAATRRKASDCGGRIGLAKAVVERAAASLRKVILLVMVSLCAGVGGGENASFFLPRFWGVNPLILRGGCVGVHSFTVPFFGRFFPDSLSRNIVRKKGVAGSGDRRGAFLMIWTGH